MKSERGQAAVLVGLLLIFVLGIAFFALSSALPGMKEGADTIGNALDEMTEQEWQNIEWQVLNGTVVSFWVNSQRFTPNKHSIETHGDDAWAATKCYNDHGAFLSMANKAGDWYLLCREEDNTVRFTVWRRESANSNRFHMINAYTPKNGVWKAIEFWLRNTHKATKATFPHDSIFIIDNIIP
jgi:hypothetical protein